MKKVLSWLARSVIFGSCLYLIIRRTDLAVFHNLSFTAGQLWILIIVLVLMPVNWLLEAKRWQLALTEETITIWMAIKQILAGLALNWIVPFTLGDVAGRLLPLKDKVRGVFALSINRLLIGLPTLILGGMAVGVYFHSFTYIWYMWAIAALFISGIAFWVISRSCHSVWPGVAALTTFRYWIFTLQFFLLIKSWVPDLPDGELLVGIGWIYLFRTFIPSLFGNFGVREASAMIFFESLLPNASIVLIPCALIWMVNTVLPSLVGLVYMSQLKTKIAA